MNRVYERRWLRFAKGGKMKYIGHLDLLKIFQSAIRRAKLPIAYSMGFNPHQRLSFALPLPVGMDSVCEYMELLLDEPAENFKKDLDAQLPDGLTLLDLYDIPEKAPRPAAAITAIDYRLTFPGAKQSKPFLDAISDTREIVVLKKTKSGEREADIRPDILALDFDPVGAVLMQLSAGSDRNLNPMLVAQKLFDDMVISPAPHEIAIMRKEMYGEINGKLVPLHEVAL
ncbi:MAG: TIGR03936 family radical SAM-associated protein [Defluviitaleaceae bacterium]|nr:TIGR03936 family radical SAM-associated protein [Defluviitaleaceae bacterium]